MYIIFRGNEPLANYAPVLSVERPIFLHTKSRFFHCVATLFAISAFTWIRFDKKRGEQDLPVDQGS